jgi:hypothetical protein
MALVVRQETEIRRQKAKGNPKSEGRNPKEIRNPKAEIAKLWGSRSALDAEATDASVSRSDRTA